MAISAGSVAAFLTLDTDKFDGALKQSRLLMETFKNESVSTADKIKTVGDSMSSVGKAMTLTVTTPIIAAGTAATKTFTTFDDSIRQVRATMAASEADTEKLTAAAKKYGAETRYSASEAAQALNYLALAGYDADKAISALPTVLQLAQAGGLDLGYASDLVTDSMSALGLEMSQLTTFSDQMAKTAQKANTNISQLGQAILTVGGTAKSLAGGTVELNALLGILADNGIKGAEGGTHLRNVLISLQTPTEEGAALLAELTNGVYDADGKMRSLDTVLQELNDSMASMTDQEKQNVIGTIFNKTDLAAVQALLSGCGDRFAELTGCIEDSQGAAAEMAAVMEGGIGGAFRNLSSAVEAVAIAFGETLAPSVQAAAEWLTEAAAKFSELDEGTRSTIVNVAAAAAAIGPLLVVLGKVSGVVSSIMTSAGTIRALMTGPAGWITLGVGGLAAFTVWASRSLKNVNNIRDSLQEANAEGLEAFRQGREDYIAEVSVDVEVKHDYAEEASVLYDDIFAWLTDGMPDTADQKKQVNEKVQAYFDSLISEVNLNESTQLESLKEQFDAGFITYDTFLERSAEVRATAEAARTELGTLCDESLAFVSNYAGKPASVVQEAYTEIDNLEKRTNSLLTSIGLVNETLGERGDNAVALTKAGATGDSSMHAMAFEHTYQQYALDRTQIEQNAEDAKAEAERIWREAYSAAEARGDQAGMDLANSRYQQLIEQADAERGTQLAELEKAYVTDIDEMFAGIASRYPEQAAVLQEAMAKIDLGDAAQKLLDRAWNGEQLSVEDLTQPMIDALTLKGVDVQGLIDAAGGDAETLSMLLEDHLIGLVKDGDSIDLAALMTEQLEGTELGTALEGVLEAGYLDGINGVDTDQLQTQMALVSAHIGEGIVIGLNEQLPRVVAAAKRLARAATTAVSDTWVIKSPSRVFRGLSNNAGESLALGFEDKERRVRNAMYRITNPTALGMRMEGAYGAAAQSGAGSGGVVFNITVPNATIRSESEAKALLKKATQISNAYNRGVGK